MIVQPDERKAAAQTASTIAMALAPSSNLVSKLFGDGAGETQADAPKTTGEAVAVTQKRFEDLLKSLALAAEKAREAEANADVGESIVDPKSDGLVRSTDKRFRAETKPIAEDRFSAAVEAYEANDTAFDNTFRKAS